MPQVVLAILITLAGVCAVRAHLLRGRPPASRGWQRLVFTLLAWTFLACGALFAVGQSGLAVLLGLTLLAYAFMLPALGRPVRWSAHLLVHGGVFTFAGLTAQLAGGWQGAPVLLQAYGVVLVLVIGLLYLLTVVLRPWANVIAAARG